jgi:hypothetical protein
LTVYCNKIAKYFIAAVKFFSPKIVKSFIVDRGRSLVRKTPSENLSPADDARREGSLRGRERARRETGRARGHFFCSIGPPQHLSSPAPPLVTMTCAPHLLQI